VVYDRPLTAVEMAYYELAMSEWEKASSTVLEATFVQATGGKATMATSIPFPSGEVPDGGAGAPLRVDRAGGGGVTLAWGASCTSTDLDYEIYEGTLGDFTSHAPALCSTAGALTATLPTSDGSSYYLVVPTNGTREGSYGTASDGSQRPAGQVPCLEREVAACR
jgi:hypothetical protein